MFHPIKDETSTRVDTEKPYYFCRVRLMALQKTSALSLSPFCLVDAPLECRARGSEGTKELQGPPHTHTDCAGPVGGDVSSSSSRMGLSDSDGAALFPHITRMARLMCRDPECPAGVSNGHLSASDTGQNKLAGKRNHC